MNIEGEAIRGNSSSPGVSGQQSGQCRWGLTTRDGVRQEAPGAPSLPVPEIKAPLKSWKLGRAAEGSPLRLYITTKCFG